MTQVGAGPEEIPPFHRPLISYIVVVAVASLALGAVSWRFGRHPDPAPLLLLSAMGILSFSVRAPEVGSRIGFSFLSIILLSSAAILGPFGAWFVGVVSVAVDRRARAWLQAVFNVAMTSIVGAAGAWAYVLASGEYAIGGLRGAGVLAVEVGLPLIVADVVGCITNAALLSGVIHFHQQVPVTVVFRRVLATSGVAYVGYGIIGFLFVILWFPAQLGAFSAILVLAPLLAARWAFIQYGEELRSHERTVDTLVTALGTKEPPAVERSRRTARLAEWLAEELGLGPSQIGTVRYAATLHEIGRLGVPVRLLRRDPATLTPAEHQLITHHCAQGAAMIEGIDFLEEARTGIRHQGERFDGTGGPDRLAGHDIPLAARVVAVADRLEELSRAPGWAAGRSSSAIVDALRQETGRFDPAVLEAARSVLEKHGLPDHGMGGPE
ncbi:metal-dependent phosphohydrolase [Intrasporangium oryzae NRRL B-24470]|uniref:Metal-dependent phosphohydrolase n=1 Tax=Intrasporangium oryzae NRRL B-24470 TaxID=1386089 RepID=W9G6T4_9MICO|nr:HD domain-containing phosphohydrolase [Intrasporangium oryzae]EWT00513.1 metal-dependent phosphohydrolase [Intrasporangium oryzae NRRL B-24470]